MLFFFFFSAKFTPAADALPLVMYGGGLSPDGPHVHDGIDCAGGTFK